MSDVTPEPQPYPAGAQAVPQQPVVQGTDGYAIASLVLGIVGLLGVAFFGFVAAVLAAVFGHVALGRISRAGAGRGGRGLAIAGLVLGYITIGLTVLFFAIVGISFGLA